MADEPGIFEVMYSLRSMRHLKADPVPEATVWRVLEAAIQAPSGGNSQPWRFVVVQDAGHKRFVQERYKRAMDLYLQANLEAASRRPPSPPEAAARQMRTARAALHLAEHLHEAPVLLLACLMPRDLPLPSDPKVRARVADARSASIYPAVQNVLLACRALGLGATLTTLHLLHEDEIKTRLGIPPEVETAALIPIGYPVGKFGPVTRAPVQEVTFWDGWEQRRARPD
jgi:nitroreductase